MRVGIVFPTVDGREATADKVLNAFEATRPYGWEFIFSIPENYSACGPAWNDGARDLLGDVDYLFFTIDDAEPHPGWVEVAARTVDAGYLPAPRMLFPDGRVESCGSMGFGQLLPDCPDKTPCRNTGILFMKPEWFAEVGDFLPHHYAVDDDWNWRAFLAGYQMLYRSGMVFTHHHELASTDHIRVHAQDHIKAFIANAATLQLPEKKVPA